MGAFEKDFFIPHHRLSVAEIHPFVAIDCYAHLLQLLLPHRKLSYLAKQFNKQIIFKGMKKMKFLLWSLFAISLSLSAQQKPSQWNLESCIRYAMDNNIQVQKSKITLEQNEVSTQQAKAQLFPNLSANIGQDLSTTPFPEQGNAVNTYKGSYSLNSSMTLYNGGKNIKSIRQQELQEEVGKADVLETQKELEMSILQNYLQILYALESIKINEATLEVSKYQRDRAEALVTAGSLSKVDLAQLDAQYNSDKYQLTLAQNTLRSNKLSLKQLLELSLSEEMEIIAPNLNDLDVLTALPSLQSVYETALLVMPQMKSSKLSSEIAELETEKARAGYIPTVALQASAGSGHNNQSSYAFGEQMQYGFNAGIGLNVKIPIFTNKENKTAVQKAALSEKTAQLSLIETEKTLLREIESVYQDALSAQSQYVSASEKYKALEISYDLIQQQYNLGMKNTLDLLTEKNNLLSAQQSMLQSKYISLMNIQLLNLYQDINISL